MRNAAVGAHEHVRWTPTSRVGRGAVALTLAALAGIVLSIVGFAPGVLEAASGFTDDWLLTGWALTVLATGAAAAVTGVVAIFRSHDRSWGVLLATVWGGVVLVVLIREVAQGL